MDCRTIAGLEHIIETVINTASEERDLVLVTPSMQGITVLSELYAVARGGEHRIPHLSVGPTAMADELIRAAESRGTLLVIDAPEFRPASLDMVRRGRWGADVKIVATCMPCFCGQTDEECTCTASQKERFKKRIDETLALLAIQEDYTMVRIGERMGHVDVNRIMSAIDAFEKGQS